MEPPFSVVVCILSCYRLASGDICLNFLYADEERNIRWLWSDINGRPIHKEVSADRPGFLYYEIQRLLRAKTIDEDLAAQAIEQVQGLSQSYQVKIEDKTWLDKFWTFLFGERVA
jgi:hypothetical protein